MNGFSHVEKKTPVRLLSPKFIVTLAIKWARCKDVPCFGPNPKGSSHLSPSSLTSLRYLASRIFSNKLPYVSKRIIEPQHDGSADLSQFKN